MCRCCRNTLSKLKSCSSLHDTLQSAEASSLRRARLLRFLVFLLADVLRATYQCISADVPQVRNELLTTAVVPYLGF